MIPISLGGRPRAAEIDADGQDNVAERLTSTQLV
jgi:hypothetical protein